MEKIMKKDKIAEIVNINVNDKRKMEIKKEIM
jgi:hypothetical protein